MSELLQIPLYVGPVSGCSDEPANGHASSAPESVNHAEAEVGRRIPRAAMINKINLIHFEDRALTAIFRHKRYPRKITVLLKPYPCAGERLDCLLLEPIAVDLGDYDFDCLLLEDGPYMLTIPGGNIHITEKGATIDLPESGMQSTHRLDKRTAGCGVKVLLSQNGAVFSGRLEDYSAVSFRVELETGRSSFRWLHPEDSIHVSFIRGADTLFTADCRLLSLADTGSQRTCVLCLSRFNVRRFAPLTYRSTRYVLELPPDCTFTHPLSGWQVERKVHDISGTGFSLLEQKTDCQLIVGMIIRDAFLVFPGRAGFSCTVQVIYRNEEYAPKEVKCGLAILSISPENHLDLLSTLHQARDPHSYLCKQIDTRALWRFFFESGFIYPEKYAYLQAYKDEVKQTYEKLYNHQPAFARHFIYQMDSRILGHLSMVRFLPKTWLLQHHASDSTNSHNAGIHVLNQVGSFVNDAGRFDSMNMEYLMCYYRPDNKFPHRVFGGVARSVGNPRHCSVDSLAYLHFTGSISAPSYEEEDRLWALEPPTRDDLLDLKYHYEMVSGGLMLDALDILSDHAGYEHLISRYRALGIERDIRVYALKKNSQLHAVIILNVSDIGINLAELTNSIMVLLVPPSDISSRTLHHVLARLTEPFRLSSIPVLLFPRSFAEERGIPFEKTYNLWVHSTRFPDGYFKYLSSLLKHVQH